MTKIEKVLIGFITAVMIATIASYFFVGETNANYNRFALVKTFQTDTVEIEVIWDDVEKTNCYIANKKGGNLNSFSIAMDCVKSKNY